MTLYDKKGRPLAVNDQVVEVGSVLRNLVVGIGRKYVTLTPIYADGTIGSGERRVDAEQVLIVKQIDGEGWVDDWDRPRPKPGRRIAWGEAGMFQIWTGFLNGAKSFSITFGTHKGQSTHLLHSELPGYEHKVWPVDSKDAGEELAERLWEGWLARRGVVFPAPEDSVPAVDFVPGNGFEVVVQDDGALEVTFHAQWSEREKGFDGVGTGRTFEEAANEAIQDAESED